MNADATAYAAIGSDGAANREIELKLELEPGTGDALLEHPLLLGSIGGPRATVSTYYDTKRHALRNAGVSLRVRKSGDRFVQTVKADAKATAGLFDRAEWEVPLAGPDPDLANLPAEVEVLRALARDDRLRPVFQTFVERRAGMIVRDGSRIEVVLDEGEVVAGKAREPLLELELELVEGSRSALFEVARILQCEIPLRLGVITKSERGERLATGRSRRSMKAEPLQLSPSMSAADAFAAISFACLRHFRANEPLVISARDPEALHQSRVALRRLRSAFSLFKPILGGDRFEHYRVELRSLAGALGEARNLDVLLKRRSDELSKEARHRLVEARTEAYDHAIAALQSSQETRLVLDIAEWAAVGDFRHRDARPAKRAVLPYADHVLERFWKKVKRRGRFVRHLEDEERHALRIAGKKLRYAGEFFSSLYHEEARAATRNAFLATLEKLQDCLGDLNDLATEHALEEQLFERGIALPGHSAAERAKLKKKHLRTAELFFNELAEIGPFWR